MARQAFEQPEPGEDKPVTCTGFFLEGPDKGNYVLVVDHPTATIQRPPAESPARDVLKRNIFAFVSGRATTRSASCSSSTARS